MKQYTSIKKQYKDMLLFFRMGDFYEMLYDDARIASKELDIVLTSREKDKRSGERIPLAGIPYHALDSYLSRLIKKGYKVAICEQVEDPKLAKGIVKREVVRIVTPGTVLEDSMLSTDNNFLMSLVRAKQKYGIAFIDISTGEFFSTQLDKGDTMTALVTEIMRFGPAECLVPISMSEDLDFIDKVTEATDNKVLVSPYSDTNFIRDMAYSTLTGHFNTVSLDGLGLEEHDLSIQACGALLAYLKETQKSAVDYITKVSYYSMSEHMLLDATTLRNLEVFQNIRNKSAKGTLLEVLDKTQTSMGGRMMRKWLKEPLIDKKRIEQRLDAVALMAGDLFFRSDTRESLKRVMDLERLITRVLYGSANARDLVGLKESIKKVPLLKEHLEKKRKESDLIDMVHSELDELTDVTELIEGGIVR
jgi:DNA mismatch repair protein MutS